jgi:hypothetical protein
VWIGTKGRMFRADPDYMQHIWGNIFDEDKLAAVVKGIVNGEDRVHFYAPYGTISKIDIQSIIESLQYAEDEGLDRPYTTGDEELDLFLLDPDELLYELTSEEPGDDFWEEEKKRLEEELQEAVDSESGDIGQWAVTIRDGNHRAFGAAIAGEPYIWVLIDDNQYQDLVNSKRKKDKELLELLQ